MRKLLPKNWAEFNISQIITQGDVFSDGDWVESKDQDPNGEVRLIQLADIGVNNFKNKSNRFLTLKKAKELKCTFLKPNDVLVARLPDPIGRACVFPLTGVFATVVDIAIIRLNQKYYSCKLLSYFLNSPTIQKQARELASGSTRQRISRKNLDSILFPLPPLTEQKRIVSKLDALFAQYEAMKKALKEIPRLLKNFRQQVLTQAVTGKLTEKWRKDNAEGEWRIVELQEISKIVDPHPSHRTPPEDKNGVPYIGIGDLNLDKTINFSNARKVSDKILSEHVSRYTLNNGDFIFGKIGTIGRPIKIPKEQNYCLSANVILIQPDPKNVIAEYLFLYMDSPYLLEKVMKKTVATSQPAYGIKKMRVETIELPTYKEQEEIVTRVKSLFGKMDKIEDSYREVKEKVDILPQTILNKAFKGELVEQLPTDGDAKDLFEQIKKLKI